MFTRCCGGETRNTMKPFFADVDGLGSFTGVTKHTGPTALHPIRRTKHSWLSACLRTQGSWPAGLKPTLPIWNTRACVRCSYPLGQIVAFGNKFCTLHLLLSESCLKYFTAILFGWDSEPMTLFVLKRISELGQVHSTQTLVSLTSRSSVGWSPDLDTSSVWVFHWDLFFPSYFRGKNLMKK